MVKRRKTTGLKLRILLLLVLLLMAAGASYLLYHHYHHIKTVKTISVHSVVGTSSNTGNTNSPSTNSTSSKSTAPDGGFSSSASNSSSSTSASNITIEPPQGPFVSNHKVSLSNSAQNNEASVCNTAPGATCYIKFINTGSGDVIQLPSETANSSGAVDWYWSVDNQGFNSGNWQIEAVASLGSQTQTSQDSQLFEVSP